jgi:2-polyprenyl-3-methyl-5-hydroxy-6-metoxy-1,4-benzoquinol methylase
MNKNYQTNNFSNQSNFYYNGDDLDLVQDADNYFKLIIKNFEPYIGLNILEVGAGSGNLTRWLRKYYPESQITTLEPSENMVNTLKAKEIDNIQSYIGFLVDYKDIFKNKFDTIIYNNVLEHIEDDVTELKLVNELLKPEGVILTYSPSIPSLYSIMDKSIGHYRRYTKKEMNDKLEGANFKILKSKYHDFLGAC